MIGFLFFIGWAQDAAAAPCYGTSLPLRRQATVGLQNYTLLKRYQEDNLGTMRSSQYFLLLSYGITDWFCIDLKGGAGSIRQHAPGSNEVSYPSSFAGGYGFRMRLIERQPWKWIWGFQHISVHPRAAKQGYTRHKAILDDWQVSTLVSFDAHRLIPYLGARWSRVDYIHRVEDKRKRVMSDASKSFGLIFGFDIPCAKEVRLNLEGSFFDSEAFAVSLNYNF